MFWIALELSIPKIGLNILLSLMVKKLDTFKFDGVAESDNTGRRGPSSSLPPVGSLAITRLGSARPCPAWPGLSQREGGAAPSLQPAITPVN